MNTETPQATEDPKLTALRQDLVLRLCLNREEQEVSLVEITPMLAAALLETQTLNRALRSRTVEQYAKDISRGAWQSYTGQAISITADCQLIDGQHRMAAIVKADKPVEMLVAFNVPDVAFEVIDTGAKRLARDVFSVQGIKNPSETPGVIRAVVAYQLSSKHGRPLASVFNNSKLTNQQNLEFALANEARLSWAISVARSIYQQRKYPVSGIGAAMFLIGEKHPLKTYEIETFFDRIKTGIELRETDSEYVLRNTLDKLRTKQNKGQGAVIEMRIHRGQLVALVNTLHAWNHHATKSRRKTLPAWNGETAPEIL